MSSDVKFVNAYIETLNNKIVDLVKREAITETQMRLAGESITEITSQVADLTEQNSALVETANTQEETLKAEREAYNTLESKYYDLDEEHKNQTAHLSSKLATTEAELASARTREGYMASDYQQLSTDYETLKTVRDAYHNLITINDSLSIEKNSLDAMYIASCADTITLQNEILRLTKRLGDHNIPLVDKPLKVSKKAKSKPEAKSSDTFE